MSEEQKPNRPSQEPLSIRTATRSDLDAITRIATAGLPDDPGCDYKYPYRHEYPNDYWKWTRVQYEEYLDQPEKFAVLIATAPCSIEDERIVDEPVAIAVWDMDVDIKSTGGDRGIHERQDVNVKHAEAYLEAILRGVAMYFQPYGNAQLSLRMLVTHPDFRRRGVGTMLCDWGEKEAVKKAWILTVMASPMGRLLYEHLGYKVVGSV